MAVVRKILTEAVFKVPTEKIRVLTHDVGGGFGMKVQTYSEYAALLYAARRTARPVKWTATRLESFLADTHGRDGVLEGELALDADGRFLALKARTYVGIGAYTTTYVAIITTWNTKNCLSSVYAFPSIYFNTKVVLTNAAPMGPYRGAGRPEALYLIESLIDRAARAMKIDRAELRRRNMIAPAAMPYKTPNGPIYDSGDFATVLDTALGKIRMGHLSVPARRFRERGQAARHWHRLLPGGCGRHPRRDRRPALRGRRQGRRAHGRAGDGAGTPVDVRALGGKAARHRARAPCGWWKATATRSRSERRASPPARS